MATKEYVNPSEDSQQFSANETEQMEIQQPRQAVATLTQSPLYFTMRINGSYYISFKRGDFWAIFGRGVYWAVINWLINWVTQNVLEVGDLLRTVVFYVLIAQIVLYFMVGFLDAGTIFQDEEDRHGEERTFCVNCKIYRRRSTKHCIWCNRCTMWYDHHCSVFGKCVGKRNMVPFWLMLTLVGTQFPFMIVLLVVHITNKI